MQSTEADRIIWLMEHFANLQNELQNILHHEVDVNIYQLQAFIQQLPVSLDDPSKRLQPDERQELRSTVSIFQIFSLLGKYIHYNRYHLLKAVVCTFGNPRSRKLMDAYVMELKTPGESSRALCPKCAVAKVRGLINSNIRDRHIYYLYIYILYVTLLYIVSRSCLCRMQEWLLQ